MWRGNIALCTRLHMQPTLHVSFGYSTLFPFFINSFSLNLFNSLLNYSEYILPTPFPTFDNREKDKVN